MQIYFKILYTLIIDLKTSIKDIYNLLKIDIFEQIAEIGKTKKST